MGLVSYEIGLVIVLLLRFKLQAQIINNDLFKLKTILFTGFLIIQIQIHRGEILFYLIIDVN